MVLEVTTQPGEAHIPTPLRVDTPMPNGGVTVVGVTATHKATPRRTKQKAETSSLQPDSAAELRVPGTISPEAMGVLPSVRLSAATQIQLQVRSQDTRCPEKIRKKSEQWNPWDRVSGACWYVCRRMTGL